MDFNVLIQQWLNINENSTAHKGWNFKILKDGESLIFKYYKSEKLNFEKVRAGTQIFVKGIQYIVSYDIGQDLYNVKIQKYEDTNITLDKTIEGLCWEDLYTNYLLAIAEDDSETDDMSVDGLTDDEELLWCDQSLFGGLDC